MHIMAPGSSVTLHVYDVGTEDAMSQVNRVLRSLGTGAFHAAIEVYGKEWCYGGQDPDTPGSGRTGVSWNAPRGCKEHVYRESVPLGHTMLDEADVRQIIAMSEEEWLARDYDLFRHNCTHFCVAMCAVLGVGPVPAWVTNLANTGSQVEFIADLVLPWLRRCSQEIRPWGEFAAMKGATSGADRLENFQHNLRHYRSNYLVITASFLGLMVLDMSRPWRLLAVLLVVAGWLAFVHVRGTDLSWRPQLCGVAATAERRTLVMIGASALLVWSALGHGVVLCVVFTLIHAGVHPEVVAVKNVR